MGRILFEFFDRYSTLTRAGSFLDVTADWTRLTWVYFDTTAFVNGDDFTAWELRSPLSQALIRVFASNVVGVFSLTVEVWLGGTLLLSTVTPCDADGWFMVGVRYTAATTTLDLFIDDTLTLSATVDLSGFPAIEVDALLQGTGPSNITVRGCRDRVWQSALTGTAIGVEFEARTAVVLPTLLADTPLTGATDLADRTGNGRNWTLDGTAFSVSGPGPSIGAVA